MSDSFGRVLQPSGVKVWTVKELADFLRIHPSTVYRLLKKKKIPAFKIGSDWRFNVEEIEAWWARKEKERK